MNKALILVLLISLVSCKTGVNNSVSNDGIDKEVLSTINSIESKYLNNLEEANLQECRSIMSDLMIKASKSDITEFLNQVASMIKGNKTSIIDQYHVQNTASELPTTLFSSLDSVAGYVLKVKPMNKEAFISVHKVESEPYQYLMLNMFTKYEDEWKLDMVKLGEYSIKNKNAQLLHYEAVEEYKNNNLINASNLIFLSSQVSKPAGNVFKYKNFGEMGETYEKILAELKSEFKFPIKAMDISTKPLILNFNPEVLNEGIIPTVSYQTAVTLSDSIELRSENLSLHKNIESYLPNIKENNEYIIYKAMNEIPDGTKEVNTYTFVNKTTEDNM
ncbi:MAG: hypothetical protein ACJATI_002088 [Halioglobus sp.]|jgi:hypothetical protein